jgi:hypothetical protein
MAGNRVSMVYDILALDHASAVFKKVTGAIEGSTMATKALTTAAGALSFGLVARQAYSFAQAASDVNEATSLTGRIFRGAQEEMISFAEGGAKAFGLSKAATLDAVNEIGNTLMNLGYDMDEAGDHTKTLIQLAGDMASAFNKEVPDALFALQAGLRGEYESLRRFGIFLDETAIKGEAMKKGLYDGTGQMDRQAKAAGALAVILKDTKTIQGDFALTSSGLANSQRILAADIENLKVSMGEGLLPVVTAGVQVMDKMVVATQGIPGPVKTGAVSFALMASAAIALAPALVSAKAAVAELNTSFTAIAAKSAKVTAVLTALLLAIDAGARVKGWNDTQNAISDTTAEMAEFTAAMDKMRERTKWSEEWDAHLESGIFGMGEWTAPITSVVHVFGNLSSSLNYLTSVGRDFGMTIEQGEQRLAGWRAAVDEAAAVAGLSSAEFEALEGVAAAFNMVAEDGITPTAQMGDYLHGLAVAAKEAREGEEEVAEVTENVAFQFSQAADEGVELLDVMNQLSGQTRSLAEAEEARLAALDAAKEEMKDGRKVLGDLTEMTAKQRAEVTENREALRGLRDETLKQIDAVMEEGRRTEDAAGAEAKAAEIRADAIEQISKMTGLRGKDLEAVLALIGGLDAIPEETWAYVGVDSATAQKRADELKATLTKLGQMAVEARIDVRVPVGRFTIVRPDGTKETYNYGQFAEGGLIDGPGGPKDDRIPILASNGEYMMSAEATDRIGVDVLNALNSGRKIGGEPTPKPKSFPRSVTSGGGGDPMLVQVVLDGEVLASSLTKASRRGVTVMAG